MYLYRNISHIAIIVTCQLKLEGKKEVRERERDRVRKAQEEEDKNTSELKAWSCNSVSGVRV